MKIVKVCQNLEKMTKIHRFNYNSWMMRIYGSHVPPPRGSAAPRETMGGRENVVGRYYASAADVVALVTHRHLVGKLFIGGQLSANDPGRHFFSHGGQRPGS